MWQIAICLQIEFEKHNVMEHVRLTEAEINHIKQAFLAVFFPSDKLWIFGSRVNANAKGGDVDLYIETEIMDAEQIRLMKFDFFDRVILAIGEQKIDIVIKFGSYDLPIYDVAKKEGVRLV